MSKLPIIIDQKSISINLPPIHPGEVLVDELAELNLSANAFARSLDVPTNRITEILKGKRAITADTALRLSRYFGTSATFWIDLQTRYDLAVAERDHGEKIKNRVQPRAA